MKFTSEDLLKAMGLKVNDVFYIGLSKNKAKLIIYENKFYYTYIGDEMFRKYHIEELIDMDIEIIRHKPTLTEDEKVILRNLPEYCNKYIVRDVNGDLSGCDEKPTKEKNVWILEVGYRCFIPFGHLFKFIKWEDEPYSIEELLKE